MGLVVFVGAAVITVAVALLTFWFFGMLYMSIGFAGWESVRRDRWPILGCFLGVILSWIFWWVLVGSQIKISFG